MPGRPAGWWLLLLWLAGAAQAPDPELTLNPEDLLSREVVNGSHMGYNLGDLLNLPHFKFWPRAGTEPFRGIGKSIVRSLPGSIIGLYYDTNFSKATVCHHQVPYHPRLLSVIRHVAARRRQRPPIERFVQRDDVVVIHLRLGDQGKLPGHLLEVVCHVSWPFKHVVLLSAIHADQGTMPHSHSVKNTVEGVEEAVATIRRCSQAQVRFHTSRNVDADLVLMAQARHLLVTRGGFSMAAALASSGFVYLVDQEFLTNDEFRLQLRNLRLVGRNPLRSHIQLFDTVAPVYPTCCKIEALRIQPRDEYLLCANAPQLRQPGCLVVSIGCAGGWKQEAGLLKHSKCHLHRLRCGQTCNPPDETPFPNRVTMHDLCVSDWNASRTRGTTVAWADAVQPLLASNPGPPAVLRISADGGELGVLRSLLDAGPELLPRQLSIRLHAEVDADPGPPWRANGGNGWHVEFQQVYEALFRRLSAAGYRLVYRLATHDCRACTEVILVHNATSLDFGDRVQKAFVGQERRWL